MFITLALLLAQGGILQLTDYDVSYAEHQAENKDRTDSGETNLTAENEAEVLNLAYNPDETFGKLIYTSGKEADGETADEEESTEDDSKTEDKEAAKSEEDGETKEKNADGEITETKKEDKEADEENKEETDKTDIKKETDNETENKPEEKIDLKTDGNKLDDSNKSDDNAEGSAELEKTSVRMEEDYADEAFVRLGFEIANARGIEIQQISIVR
ncbi:MAG: hypothetical protein LBM19_04770 [Holosporales bacterium]|jgi:hypothetical protein|nr:hypothetical protein [Holosporales bacterium]